MKERWALPALRVGCRVGEREDDWPLIDFSHLGQNFFVESAANAGKSNEGSGLNDLDDVDKIFDLFVVGTSIRYLPMCKSIAPGYSCLVAL